MIQRLLRTTPAKVCLSLLISVTAVNGGQGTIVTNVRDVGAKGDGQTDDSAAWQVAVNGGDVFCPPGVYIIGKTILVPSNRHISGSPDCTLKTKDRTDVPVFTLTDVRDVFIERISIDGNKATQIDNGLGFGVLCWGCSKTKIIGLRIANTPVEAIIVGKNERAGTIPEDVLIIDNESFDSSRPGTFRQHYAVTSGRRILISGNSGRSADGHAAYLVDIEPNNSENPIEDISVVGNHGAGVSAVAVPNNAANGRIVKRITITGNDVKGPGAGAGHCFPISYADYVSVGSNTVEGCGLNGVNISGSNYVAVTGNVVKDFGKSGTSGETNGVKIDAGSRSVVIDRNVFQTNAISFGILETDAFAAIIGRNDYIGNVMTPTAVLNPGSSSRTGSFAKHLSASAAVDFAGWDGEGCEEKPILVPGALDGSTVLLSLPPALASVLSLTGSVSSPGVVTVKACKLMGGPTSDPPAAIVRVDVWIER